MKKPKRPTRMRSLLRRLSRSDEKLAEARIRLSALEPGGAPERPIELASASLVERRAEALACLRCGERNECKEHVAEDHDGELLRVAVLACRQCGAPRRVYFAIRPTLLN